MRKKEKYKKGRIWKIIGLIIGVVLLVLATAIFVQVDFSNPKDLEKFVQVKMEKAGMNGVSIAIIKDNKIDRIINYGDADKELGKPITNNTVFQIASVSKTVTATAVMQLVEKGAIQLDDDINAYLPFRIVHPKFPDTPITFRMLLDHTSGLDNNWELYDSLYTTHSGGGDSTVTLEQFMKEFFIPGGKWYDEAKNFTNEQPGSTFAYSNTGYGLLGYLVEEITKTPFPEYTQQQIFDPVGMTHTNWLHRDMLIKEALAVQYDSKGKALVPYSLPTYPDGTLKTTTTDFAKFYLAIMNGGQVEGGNILSPATLEEMFKPQSDNGNQALGWSYSVLDSLYLKGISQGKVIGHTGSDPGVQTITMFNPDNKSGLILFFNQELNLNLRTLNLHSMIKRLVKEAGM
ncbi:CubicO group peptidase (beta-lactamase class C family) [Paenibacillus anaericanus]|uniref:serine hydrolase domain-containing protein n=1 Tax=Paenibacillus anaericanus TaxID=170367 RepID=UPI002783AD56|nr:serine hydrolase domain-containing protein [Paenibacillus anaericanus]MDQ0091210.1 CubicO group peptidase (beta-lactamase class C family) [Paenibacillus anaericanus]